jgi:hypothetical protein
MGLVGPAIVAIPVRLGAIRTVLAVVILACLFIATRAVAEAAMRPIPAGIAVAGASCDQLLPGSLRLPRGEPLPG